MHYTLNFGPTERTLTQRQAIADRAIAFLRAAEHEPTPELLALYARYVLGETDLYAVSVYVNEQPHQSPA
jgi:hypothetical protein